MRAGQLQETCPVEWLLQHGGGLWGLGGGEKVWTPQSSTATSELPSVMRGEGILWVSWCFAAYAAEG